MNKITYDVLLKVHTDGFENQRCLAEKCEYSLGGINKALSILKEEKYIDSEFNITSKGVKLITTNSPKNAVILAAGRGMRMVPINLENPKALVEVKGKALIEHQIEHLHSIGVNEIYIVVGFLKEQFEYLIDKYNVNLVINTEYNNKNNLFSLSKIADKIGNTYIIPCDVWCEKNPFNQHEICSWYMMSKEIVQNSDSFVNKKQEVVRVKKNGNRMIGISYISKSDSKDFIKRLKQLSNDSDYDNSFWEEACYEDGKMFQYANIVNGSDYTEINTYEDLRSVDSDSNHLKSDAIEIIKQTFDCDDMDVVDIKTLKKGMTNRSFLFTCRNKKYIMRIPGEGTNKLVNRNNEADVYTFLRDKNICDNIVYLNPENGIKIAEYIEHSRTCDYKSIDDLKACMLKLKKVHNLDINVDYRFDLFEQIEFYEHLRNGKESVYRDYNETKANVYKLKEYIDRQKIEYKLTHIDAVSDNFLFYDDTVCLIDWEYSAMQDPHIDLAMFSIYSFYNKEQIDQLIDIYFENNCSKETRIKIYCYVAICGLLWSNWCEYKLMLGVEFGEYSIKQYRYAKEFYRLVIKELGMI